MAATLALAGDTMLGRKVGDALLDDPDAPLVETAVAARIAQADAFVLNLECCISARGERFPDPHKPFFFRAPAVAARRLRALGVDAVTLANNHSLDYGRVALRDTIQRELRALRARWLETIVNDPYYSPLLSLDSIPFSALAWPPRADAARFNQAPQAVAIPPGM